MPLTRAARYCEVLVIESLVVFGAEIDTAIGDELWTPLIRAVAYGRIDAVRLFLALNADMTKIDVNGKTALQHAGRRDATKQLLLGHEKKSVKLK